MFKTAQRILAIAKFIVGIPVIIVAVIAGGIVGIFQGIRGWFRPMFSARPAAYIRTEYEAPERFKDLLCLAERLDIGDDVERLNIESMLSESEKDDIRSVMAGRAEDLEQWIDSTMENGQIAEFAVPFSNMLQALSEMGLLEAKPETKKATTSRCSR